MGNEEKTRKLTRDEKFACENTFIAVNKYHPTQT